MHLVRSGEDEHFVMSYTNLPPPEANEFWRIGVHRLDVRGRRASRSSQGSGSGDRAAGRARQGRHRLQPARRPRRAHPPHLPEHAARGVRLARAALGPAGRLLGGAHGRARAAHDHPAGRRRRSASAPARRRSSPTTGCCSCSTSATATSATARRRRSSTTTPARSCRCSPSRSCRRSSTGSGAAT